MVLGEGMREAGVACHKIPPTLPGVAYVIPETGGAPMRVRAARITDVHIKDVAARFPAASYRPILIPPPADTPVRPGRRRSAVAADSEGRAA